jgi:hypothetical protein
MNFSALEERSMSKRTFAVLSFIFITGVFSIAHAQVTTRLKADAEVTPAFTYKGRFYGFVTCHRLQREGNTVKPEDVKKCVSEGGRYVLHTGGRYDLKPQDKIALYAGQQVLITGITSSRTYGTGPTHDPAVDGFYSGIFPSASATKFEIIDIISVQAMPAEPPRKAEHVESRVAPSAME